MNWCKRHKDRNWDNVMFSDEWTFNLKAPEGIKISDEKWTVCGAKDQVYS